MKFIVSIIALFLFIGNINSSEIDTLLNPKEIAWLKKNGRNIRFAPNPAWPPMDFFDPKGHHSGIVADYIQIFEDILGFEFQEIHYNNWSDVINGLKYSEVDFVGAINKTSEREQFLNFTEAYLFIPIVILVRNDYVQDIEEEDISSMHLAVVKDYASTSYIQDKYPQAKLTRLEDDLSALLQTSLGKTDGTLIDLTTASYLVDKYGINNLSLGIQLDYNWHIRLGSVKSKPILNSILNKLLKSVPLQQKEKINARWLGLNKLSSKSFLERNYKILLLLGLGIFLLTLVITYNNRLLKKKVYLRTKKLKEEISKKNEALQKAKDSEENYKALFTYSALPKWIYDLDSLKFVNVNQTAIDLYGYSKEEFLSMNIKVIRPVEEIPRLLNTNRKKKVSGATTYYGVWNHIKKNGEKIQVEIYGHPINFEGKKCKTITCNDITKQLENEKMLMDFAENLERKVEIRTEELINAHSVLLEQHQEITDSINYAKRIQNAILPKKEEFKKIFSSSFILFKPKDVVSGDFYCKGD